MQKNPAQSVHSMHPQQPATAYDDRAVTGTTRVPERLCTAATLCRPPVLCNPMLQFYPAPLLDVFAASVAKLVAGYEAAISQSAAAVR